MLLVFFFKQKTAYDMRISDWSSDVCSSDLGLPVPVKSSCFFCAAMKPHEVQTLPAWCLRLIVLMEARAAPRLINVEGLWRRSTRARPGTMTEFIRDRGLLPPREDRKSTRLNSSH